MTNFNYSPKSTGNFIGNLKKIKFIVRLKKIRKKNLGIEAYNESRYK